MASPIRMNLSNKMNKTIDFKIPQSPMPNLPVNFLSDSFVQVKIFY